MRVACGLFVALAACSSGPNQILVEVDADPSIIHDLTRVEIIVRGGGTITSSASFDLTSDCLPLSVAVAPDPGNERASLAIDVTAQLARAREATLTLETTFTGEPRYALFLFPSSCATEDCSAAVPESDVQVVDLDELRSAIEARQCTTEAGEVVPEKCIEDLNGCYEINTNSHRCLVPCPPPNEVLPPDPPLPPAPVAPPNFDPCPPNWTLTGTPPSCEPWPSGQATFDCPLGQARFPSTPACADIGPPCAAAYATDPPPGRRIYVDPTAPTGGDGTTETSPLTTLTEAITRSTAGDVILLAPGTYATDPITIDHPLTVIGSCAKQTIIPATFTTTATAVTIAGAQLRAIIADEGVLALTGIELRNSTSDGLRSQNQASVTATDLVIRETRGNGIEALSGGQVSATRVVIDRAQTAAVRAEGPATQVTLIDAALLRTKPASDGFAYGITARAQAHASIDKTIVEDTAGYGVEGRNEATLSITASLIRDVAPDNAGDFGAGLRLEESATATISKTAITDVHFAGIYASGNGRATITDLLIRDIADANSGPGLLCIDRCDLAATRIYIQRAKHKALVAEDSIILTDLTIADTITESRKSEAIAVPAGKTIILKRVLLQNHATNAISIQGAATIEDLTIPGPSEAIGVFVSPGAQLDLSRALIDRAKSAGIRIDTARGVAASVTLEDVTVRDTQPHAKGEAALDDGYGLRVGYETGDRDDHAPASVKLTRGLFERNVTAGIGFSRVDPGELNHVRVVETARGPQTEDRGVGLVVTAGSQVTGDRIELFDNLEAGLFVGLFLTNSSDFQTSAKFSNIRIEGTHCDEDGLGCAFVGGAGAATGETGNFELTRFAIRQNTSAGIKMLMSGEVYLYDGSITGENVGAFINIVKYDLGRLIRGVTYDQNRDDIFVVATPE